MSLTNILYPNNYLPDLARVAFWVGTSAASSVLLFGATSGATSNSLLNWRDVAVWGYIGATLGAHFGVTSNPWFKR